MCISPLSFDPAIILKMKQASNKTTAVPITVAQMSYNYILCKLQINALCQLI